MIKTEFEKNQTVPFPQCCPEIQEINVSLHRPTCLINDRTRLLYITQKCERCGHKHKETYLLETIIGETESGLNEYKTEKVCYFCEMLARTDAVKEFDLVPHYKKLRMITSVYADGGLIGMNRYGGTWAWCGVTVEGKRIITDSGYVIGPPTQPKEGKAPTRNVTNNHTEQIAIIKALEAMPEGWEGTVYSDSSVALSRVFENGGLKNLPRNIIERTRKAVDRLGPKVRWRCLKGHPTEFDLKYSVKSGRPVSIHNVWCDLECENQREVYFSRFDVEGKERIK